MTEYQKTMVQNYREKLNHLRNEEISNRVRQKLASMDKIKQKFDPMLKIKITDVMSFHKTAIVTFWYPSEEISATIQEGSAYEMTQCSAARGDYSNELQINAGKSTIFKKLNMNFQLPTSLQRCHTSISEIGSIDQPLFNELDTTGLVIHVGDVSTKFQPVYMADNEQNIICIYFWNDVKNYAYDDVVQPKRFLAIKNLQWRSISNSKPIPCAFVTDFSIFTENPQSSELLSAITSLKEKFISVNINEFIKTCMEKIKSHKSPIGRTPVRSYSVPSMPGEFRHSTLSNKSRIELLSKYGDPMSTPPLQIKSLNKSFKHPTLKD